VEADVPIAPPVVAVVVVHTPGEWFAETLASLAEQDYPNLDTLFLLAGDPVDADGNDLAPLITEHLPDAYVRPLGGNPGFGAAANEVLRLVEGDNGFFCICHDDVVLEPDVIRTLVEELYRSNAGLVGPKLVTWDDAAVLQHVGLGLDRFGEVDPITEPGEYDQEQHDAVRDTFVLPSACILARADLFRALGGYDPAISFHGDDVDLCWRAHLSGARVVVAPQARVRHREELTVRRPDLHHDALRARHRMRSVATLTSGARLPVRSLELVLLTVTELFVGLFTGRLGEAWSSLRALVGLVPRTPALFARRRAVARIRRVDDTEVLGLLNRGSARLTRYRRARDTETYIGAETAVRRWRESQLSTTIATLLVVVFVIAASRTMIDRGVPGVGELLPLPESPRAWWADFTSAWNPGGLGSSSANPTGWGLLSIASVLWLGRMGLGLTVIVVGLVLLGIWGTWRLATVFPSNRARIAALVVYTALPLVPGVISSGRLSALVAYAAVPWFVHLVRTAAGIGTADPSADAEDLIEGVLGLRPRERIRRTALLGLASAVAVAIAPAVLPVLVLVAIVLGLTTLAAGAGVRTAGWLAGLGLAGCALAFVLNLPWSTTWSWDELVAPSLAGAAGRGVVDVSSMAVGRSRFEVLALALYAPVLVALLVARAWRLTWAARAAGLVVVFLGLAVLQDRDALPLRLPEVGILLAPVGLGLALAAAASTAAFGQDVAGRTFGWRQPLGLLGLGAVVVGSIPALFAVTDGAWYAPRTSLVDAVQAPLPAADELVPGGSRPVGDYRTLYIGDPRLIPFPSQELGDGVAIALVDDGPADLRDRWPVADQAADDALHAALDQIATAGTRRGGRLLAPFGIRSIVVPVVNGVESTAESPLPIPGGLVDALGAQLDLARGRTPPSLIRFDNTAFLPVTASLEGELAAASAATDPQSIAAVDTAGAAPVLVGADTSRAAGGDVPAGVVHLGTSVDDHWELTVGGTPIAPRPSFGVATAFDVATAGPAELRFVQPLSRSVWLVVQALLWLAAIVAATRFTGPTRLRPRRVREETLIDLDAEPSTPLPEDRTGFGGWVDEPDLDDPAGLGALARGDAANEAPRPEDTP
jgi:GT2 family glycosyltransferase